MRGPGRPFQPGQSGNPAGRPKTGVRFAALVLEKTRGGADLVEFAVEVMQGQQFTVRDRLRAMEFLAERLLGRPSLPTELAALEPVDDHGPPLNLNRLTDSQLAELERLVEAATPVSGTFPNSM